MTQKQALLILKTGVNVFLTGEPGSGKTFVINQYIRYLRRHKLKVAVTASTGIAATHINGTTIHSWSGIGVRKSLTDRDFSWLFTKRQVVKRIENTHVLIIDEISMLDAKTLSLIDQVLKKVRRNLVAFGGIQVVFVGDFFQLPPVSTGNAQSSFAFESMAWVEAKPVVCYLSEQHRQLDTGFTQLLGSIRSGTELESTYSILTRKQVDEVSDDCTQLYTHNADVDLLNEKKLAKLPGKIYEFPMSTHGRKQIVEQLKKGCLSPEILTLKVGAKVMFTKNNFEVGFVNGTLGEVIDVKDSLPIVLTSEHREIAVKPMDWVIEENDKIKASITQIPLRLAWAITVHKSQGMTLDEAVIDLSDAFEYGQGYVAISRVKSLQGLSLLGINQRALETHPIIQKHDHFFKLRSQKAAQLATQYTSDEFRQKHHDFILRCGGSLKKVTEKVKSEKSTYEQTFELFKKGLSLAQIAKQRNLKQGTIITHIERLYEQELISAQEVGTLIPQKLAKKLSEITCVFHEKGTQHLAPVFEHLKGKYSYDELRLVRMTMVE